MTSLKKLAIFIIVKFVCEYFTSQTCANCFGRFPEKTKRDPFEACYNCQPNVTQANLPDKVLTQRSKRDMQKSRKTAQHLLNIENILIGVAKLLSLKQVKPICHDRFQQRSRLVSKVIYYRKNRQLSGSNADSNRKLDNTAASPQEELDHKRRNTKANATSRSKLQR